MARGSVIRGLLICVIATPASAQSLDLPLRQADASSGRAVLDALVGLDLEAREDELFREMMTGNVPSWLRVLRPVEMTREVDGREHIVVFHVTADYLSVGSADDYFLIPLSPQTAQRVADATGMSLLTRPMVDAVWHAADVRLGNDSIPPGPEMVTIPVFANHNGRVRARRLVHDEPLGALVAGHKKDVVLTSRLDSLDGRVAIYGWHRPTGEPIQPLYVGHADRHVDYSHGIRLAHRTVLIDGEPHDMVDLLRDPARSALLSDDGPIGEPRYSTGVGPSGGRIDEGAYRR